MAEAAEFLMIVGACVAVVLGLLLSLAFAVGAIILAGRVMLYYLTRRF